MSDRLKEGERTVRIQSADELTETPGEPHPQGFQFIPAYTTLPVTPTPVLENGLAVAWDIPTTMTDQNVIHTVIERYVCEEDEILAPTDPRVSRILERAMSKLASTKDVLRRCAKGLEEKIAALKGEEK